MTKTRALTRPSTALALGAVLALGGCSLAGGEDDSAAGSGAQEVVLVTHDSFALPDEVVAQFEEESGYELVLRASGDAGTLTNKLALTKDDPTGDVAFGVDNTFASRALEEGVFAPYTPAELPAGVAEFALPGDDAGALTPVDNGNVCVNVDTAYFAEAGTAPPETLADLTDPAYRDLFVTPGATTSSPGMAFLLSTIAEFGDAWPDYWADLVANGAKLTEGWEDAYYVDFTQGGGDGQRPIVLSYDSSPAFTVDGEGGTTTAALLGTCFRQVEYVGVLEGAANVEGARALVDFMLTPAVQEALPESMYVFPVAQGTALPADWAEFAQQPTDPYAVDPLEIASQRDTWLREWSDVTSR